MITASGIPVFGSTVFLTAEGLPVLRIGTSTSGISAEGEPVFGFSSTVAANQPWTPWPQLGPLLAQ